VAFLDGDEKLGERRWSGTLLTDRYGAYDTVVDPRLPGRSAACAARTSELRRADQGRNEPYGLDALRRFARIYEVEGELKASATKNAEPSGSG
jgi:hypothetical protein